MNGQKLRIVHTYLFCVPRGDPPSYVGSLARGGTDLVHPGESTGRPYRSCCGGLPTKARGTTAATVVAAGGSRGKAIGFPTVTAVTERKPGKPPAA